MKKNEKRQQTKGYFATVNGVNVEGKTYTEFTINYLTELVNQNKNLDFTDRLYAYIDYFVKNFSYDNDLRDRVLSRMIDETTEIKEESLLNLLHDGRGVCDQLAQAFSMLGSIDSELWQHGIVIEYSTCNISVKGKKMGHAVNHIVVGGNRFVVDLSTIIHCRQKDYQADEELFKLVGLDEYRENMESIGIDILPLGEEIEEQFANFKLHIDPKEYYKRLNTPTDEINSKHQDWIYGISIEKVDYSQSDAN